LVYANSPFPLQTILGRMKTEIDQRGIGGEERGENVESRHFGRNHRRRVVNPEEAMIYWGTYAIQNGNRLHAVIPHSLHEVSFELKLFSSMKAVGSHDRMETMVHKVIDREGFTSFLPVTDYNISSGYEWKYKSFSHDRIQPLLCPPDDDDNEGGI